MKDVRSIFDGWIKPRFSIFHNLSIIDVWWSKMTLWEKFEFIVFKKYPDWCIKEILNMSMGNFFKN